MCESSDDYVNVRFWIGKGESKDLSKNNEHDEDWEAFGSIWQQQQRIRADLVLP